MKTQIKRMGVLAAGWVFILLGVAGLFLPILQGVLFLLIGLLILSTEYVWAHHLLLKLKERFPHVAEHLEHAKQRAERWAAGRFHKRTTVKPKDPETQGESGS